MDDLFIYGTLHPGRAPADIAPTVRKLKLLGPATIRGKLYDLGAYPGLVLGPTHTDEIPGHIFTLPSDTTTLPVLDAYEGFDEHDPANSLYLRTQQFVTLADATQLLCWVYLYNGTLPS